jgi:hypothetical protein
MTLSEMRDCATETLTFFIQSMPDVPFTESGIVIEFAPKAKMADRARALCAEYVPDKIINETQAEQLENSIAANALIGREKSAVIVRVDHRQTQQGWRRILFHEFTHIFCAKLEMNGEHFIDIYGSGHTPDLHPENEIYDGQVNAGYVLWSEFIAQYYALKYCENAIYNFCDISDSVFDTLGEISVGSGDDGKSALAQICAYMLTCKDTDETLAALSEPNFIYPEGEPGSEMAKAAFQNVILFLRGRLQNEKPWKITEEFIADLGGKYIWFITANSRFLGEF